MKKIKTRITCSFLLSILLLLFTVNSSLAADPSEYIGVSLGDKPAWTISLHGEGMLAIADDMPDNNLPFNSSSAPSWLSSLTISLNLYTEIEAVSTNGTMHLFNGTDVAHVNLTVSGYYQLPIFNVTSPTEEITVVVLDPDTSNFTYLTGILLYKAMNKMFGGNETTIADSENNMILSALIMPKGITWAPIVSDLNVYLDMINDTMMAEVFGNGVKVTIPAYTLNETQAEDIIIEATYDGNGLLATATLTYGGTLALSISYGATNIPGFELAIVIGMTAIGTIGLIYAVKRKRKIIY